MIAEFISPEILGIVLIAVMLFSIFVGFPISFTLIFLGFVFWLFRFWSSCVLSHDPAILYGYD